VEVLVVLVAFSVAFVIGWAARGRTGRDGSLGTLIEDAQTALERAVAACAPALAIADGSARGDVALPVALDVLERASAALAPLAERLRAEVGPDHPLTEEFEDASSAIALVQSWLSAGATPGDAVTARGLERAAHHALGRFRRIGRAIRTA
jgi:hypothetical protein